MVASPRHNKAACQDEWKESVGVGSSADGKRDTLAILLFALALVAVLMIIVDLNRPQQGVLTVSQRAMSDLLRQMTP